MECVPVKLDLVDRIVANVGRTLLGAQTPLVSVRRAMLLQHVASVLLDITDLQMEPVNV